MANTQGCLDFFIVFCIRMDSLHSLHNRSFLEMEFGEVGILSYLCILK